MSNPYCIFMEKTYGHFGYCRHFCILQPEVSETFTIFSNDPSSLYNKAFLFPVKIRWQVPSEAIIPQKEVAMEVIPIMAR